MSKISYDAIIIGAGFSGLYQLYKLRDQLNLNCRVLEKGSGIGGTWYWNRYPGARCDTESHAYTYFFFLKKYFKNGSGVNAIQVMQKFVNT